jgi:hypothetical protein
VPDHSSRVRAYTNYPRLCCRADKFIIGRYLLCNDADLAWSNLHISVTIGVAIISTALIFSPSIPAELHSMAGSTYFALASVMACRVFRVVFLGTIKDPQENTAKIVSFYRSTADTRDDNDVEPGRSSRLDINFAVETVTAAESNGPRIRYGKRS